MDDLQPDLEEAERFLQALDPGAGAWTFQSFDDSELKRGHYARIAHGTLESEAKRLVAWNAAGAGIFVMVNEGDGLGRKAENVCRIRALFLDLDGSPLEPVLRCALPPHIVVESSPGRWHVYWRVADGFPLSQFSATQKALARRFGGDPSVHDLPRVMRCAGFLHRKGSPTLTRIHGHA